MYDQDFLDMLDNRANKVIQLERWINIDVANCKSIKAKNKKEATLLLNCKKSSVRKLLRNGVLE